MQLPLGCRVWKQQIAYSDFSSKELQLLETRRTDLKFLNVQIYGASSSKSAGCLTVRWLSSWTRATRLPHRRCAFGPEQQQQQKHHHHPNLQFHTITAWLHPAFQNTKLGGTTHAATSQIRVPPCCYYWSPCGLTVVPRHKEFVGLDQKLKRDQHRQRGHLIYASLFSFEGENPQAINCPQYRHGHCSTMKHISAHSVTKHRTDCWSITISTS